MRAAPVTFLLVSLIITTGCSTPTPSPPAGHVAITRPLGTFSGRGDHTIGVVSESGHLRISWATRNEEPAGTGTFRLALHSGVSGRPIELIIDQRGEVHGTRDVTDDPRPYNLMVDSQNLDWTVTVEEIVSARVRPYTDFLRVLSVLPVIASRERSMFETVTVLLLLHAAGAHAPVALMQPTAPPYEGRWIVEVIDGVKVMPDSQVTMRIEGGNIDGIASCNNYRATITVRGTSVTVGELLRTMKTCDAARLSEENDFLALLPEVVRYEVQSRDILELKASDGKTIVATRAPENFHWNRTPGRSV